MAKTVLRVGDRINCLTILKIRSVERTFSTGSVRTIKEVWAQCVCERKKWIRYEHAKGGRSKSCGCLNYLPRTVDPDLRAAKYVWNYLTSSSRKRALAMRLSVQEVGALVFLPCTYCGSLPSGRSGVGPSCRPYGQPRRPTNGIDRVDSQKGYVRGNVVPCCSVCNTMKFDLSVEEFRAHVERVYSRMIAGEW